MNAITLNKIVACLLFSFPILISAQEIKESKFEAGLKFSSLVAMNNFSFRTLTYEEESKYSETGSEDPIFGTGVFFEYRKNNHSFGLSHQTSIFNYDYEFIYLEDRDTNGVEIGSKSLTDYTDVTINALHLYYKHSFNVDRLSLYGKVSLGHNRVKLTGHFIKYEYAYFSSLYDQYRYSDQVKVNYLSFKPEFGFSFMLSSAFGLQLSAAYDIPLSNGQDYSFNFDANHEDEQIAVERNFTPARFWDISFGGIFRF